MSTHSHLASRSRGLCLLSLDAGGSRSISQPKLLAEIMHRWNYGSCEDQMYRPHAIFDMIGGVGSGGYIAILLAFFKLTAEEALEEFIHLTVNVLDKQGLNVEARTTALRDHVNNLLEKHGINRETRLLDRFDQSMACKLVVPISYKQNVGSLCILRNYPAPKEQTPNLTIAEALLATLSTPPHFASLSIIKDAATFEYTGADWALGNPTQEIITEAHAAFGAEGRVACLLSLGCGCPGTFASPVDPTFTEWNRFLERLAVDGERKAQSLESQMGPLGIYYRFNVAIGLEASIDSLLPGDIITHTAVYLADVTVSRKTDTCVNFLKLRDGVSSLEQLKHHGGQGVLSLQLPPLTKTFVMRKEPWEFIERVVLGQRDPDDIDGPRMLFVTGMGGCGKTQLMLRFMKLHEKEFPCQLFVDGSSVDRIRADIIRNVRAMGNEHSQKGFEECIYFLSQRSTNGLRLLLYDNVDNPAIDLSALLPRDDSCAIVITSRNHLLGVLHPDAHLQLDAMSLDEAVELLLGRSARTVITDQDREEAAILAQALGCLPIALQQARSYMQQTQCSSKAYLERLASSRRRLLGQAIEFQIGMQSISTYAAFETSFGRLSLRVQQFIRLLSYFHWSNFPLELVVLAAKYQFSEYQRTYIGHGEEFNAGKSMLQEIFLCNGEWDIANLDDMMVSLQNYSLVTVTPGVGTALLHMHPLVHEWLRSYIPRDDWNTFQSAAILLLAMGARNDHTTFMQYLGSHVTHMSSLWNDIHVNNAAAFGFILLSNGRFPAASQLQERVVKCLRVKLDAGTIGISIPIESLALTYMGSGRLKEAAALQEEVLMLRKGILGERHPHYTKASSNLANTYYHLGRLNEAEVLQKEVLKLSKEIHGVNHSDTINASSNLALTYRDLGRMNEAVMLQEEVLKLSKELLGERHLSTTRALSNLAGTYCDLGRLREAEVLQEKVLKLRKETLGERHPDTISASSNLALTYSELGMLREAEGLEEEVLKLRKEILGDQHPNTIRASHNLAATYHKSGRLGEAEVLEEEALKLRRETFGERHPSTTNSCILLAEIYISGGKTGAALELLNTVERIIAETLGVAHSQYLRCQRIKSRAQRLGASTALSSVGSQSRPIVHSHTGTT